MSVLGTGKARKTDPKYHLQYTTLLFNSLCNNKIFFLIGNKYFRIKNNDYLCDIRTVRSKQDYRVIFVVREFNKRNAKDVLPQQYLTTMSYTFAQLE